MKAASRISWRRSILLQRFFWPIKKRLKILAFLLSQKKIRKRNWKKSSGTGRRCIQTWWLSNTYDQRKQFVNFLPVEWHSILLIKTPFKSAQSPPKRNYANSEVKNQASWYVEGQEKRISWTRFLWLVGGFGVFSKMSLFSQYMILFQSLTDGAIFHKGSGGSTL